MAIDADLNAGILTPDEAKARREEVTKEADFYGSMDGASKFVKGDAIAGILILLVNIIGGLIIGWSNRFTDWPSSRVYILLSIGDGLVAQIPSLLLSIATAIIVTRASAQNMSEHITKKPICVDAHIPVILALVWFLECPINYFFFAAIAGLLAYLSRRKEQLLSNEVDEEKQSDSEEGVLILMLIRQG